MSTTLYLKLSFAMFMEFAIWGAWFPVLAPRLLGPLKMSGKQTGWIYATLPLACIVFPILAGLLADQYFATEWIIIVCHAAGAILIFFAARQTKFTNLFLTLLIYSAFYTATLPLVNSMMFHHLGKALADDPDKISVSSKYIFLWAPVAWALAGYFLTGWRWKFKTGEEGKDCLYMAAILSVVMVIGGLLLFPSTPAAKTNIASIFKTFSLLSDSNFLLFIIVSMIVAGLMPFYFQGTAPFMQEIGIPAKNIPASMAIAQACQALATLFLLSLFLTNFGNKWTLIIGAACWGVLYVIYIATNQRFIIIPAQALHGLAYVFFIIGGQIYTNAFAPKEMSGSAQGLIFAATSGLGMFLGSQAAGFVMDKSKVNDKIRWHKVFIVPVATVVVCLLAFILFFKDTTG